jgi:hypothetical protein
MRSMKLEQMIPAAVAKLRSSRVEVSSVSIYGDEIIRQRILHVRPFLCRQYT